MNTTSNDTPEANRSRIISETESDIEIELDGDVHIPIETIPIPTQNEVSISNKIQLMSAVINLASGLIRFFLR